MSVEKQWRVDLENLEKQVDTAPTIVDDTIYVGCDDGVGSETGVLCAFESETGSERWRFETGDEISGAPAVVDGTVLVGSEDGICYAVDAADGTERWRYDFDSLVYEMPSPAVLDGTAYVGTHEHGTPHLCALDVEGGSVRWRREMDGGIKTAPTVIDGPAERTVVVTVDPVMDDASLVALDAGDGSERWRYTTETPLETAPAVASREVPTDAADDHPAVFLLDRYQSAVTRAYDALADDDTSVPPSVEREQAAGTGGSIYCFDAVTGEKRLQIGTPAPPTTTPTIADGTLYAGTEAGTLFAADVGTGELQWEQQLGIESPTRVTAAPTVVGDQVVTATAQGGLFGLDTDGGDVAWMEPVGMIRGCAPIAVDGTVYIGGSNGVAAVDVPDCTGNSRGSRVRRATLGHHDETAHRRTKPETDDTCLHCGTDLSAVESPSYCWNCGWELRDP
ncbi:outer membrane protein assembly factor BamB family protein [Halopiger goleimassiliensis]|uniref:outer membrane protein assembly factor BamB family protein n=1 Tax=Halopiger goleimassiliensis TaxID=1293048 RepID=UPI0018A81F1F|nr:PQQ-binding-like beta-propeller repeat protein [Halopiger goleimassiliensis]